MEWDIQEVKRLKKKELIQSNLMMLLLFILLVYAISVGWSLSIILSLISVILWILAAHAIYNLATGKKIGTKTSRLVQAFDKERYGKKNWKRKKWLEASFIVIISSICIVLVFKMDLSFESMSFIKLLPIVGAWLGINTGEVIRINNLS